MQEIAVAALVVATVAASTWRATRGDEWVPAVAGVAALAALGAVDAASAARVTAEVAPVVVFLLAVTALSVSAARSGVFDRGAVLLGRLSGSGPMLLVGIVALTAAVTTLLSLDAAVVLLTPVVVTLARRSGAPVLPAALAVVLVANAGSLLLPVSNLTNLLVAERIGPPLPFAARMLPAELAVLAVIVAVLGHGWRRAHADVETGEVPQPAAAASSLMVLVLLVLVPVVLLTTQWGLAAGTSALAALAAVTGPAPRRLVPDWRLGIFVAALLVVVDAGAAGLLGQVAAAAAAGGPMQLGLVGAVAASVLTNLPAVVLLEPAAEDPAALRALLVGVNVGPNVVPTASLATLLWLAQLRALGADRGAVAAFVRLGALVTAVALPAALALVLVVS